jgi:hypothetical protein
MQGLLCSKESACLILNCLDKATLISSSLINWITFFKVTTGQFLIRIAISLLVAKFDNSFKMFLSEYFLSSLA